MEVSVELSVPFNSFDTMDYWEFLTQYNSLAEIANKRREEESKSNGMVSIQNAFGG